jgi:protein TonB
MFEESLVESTPILRTRNRLPVLASISAQACIVAALLAIPLLHPEILPTTAAKLLTLAPPPLPKPIPPPQQPLHMVTTTNAPSISTPAQAAHISSTTLTQIRGQESSSPAVPNFNSTAIGSGNAPPIFGSGPASSSPPISVQPAARAARPSISLGVAAGMLLAPIQPVYPQIARLTHTEGTVVIHAIISKSGAIESARVTSGPAMLQPAALEAVRSARYRPYLLNNQPTEVETTISISFHMYN